MTRKDYGKFANMINGLPFNLSIKKHFVDEMVRIFINDNPAFNCDRFFKACFSRNEMEELRSIKA